jgi:hypothetical protein
MSAAITPSPKKGSIGVTLYAPGRYSFQPKVTEETLQKLDYEITDLVIWHVGSGDVLPRFIMKPVDSSGRLFTATLATLESGRTHLMRIVYSWIVLADGQVKVIRESAISESGFFPTIVSDALRAELSNTGGTGETGRSGYHDIGPDDSLEITITISFPCSG